MPTMIRGGYPDIAFFVPDNRYPQNRMAFICRVESDSGFFVSQPMAGLIGRSKTDMIFRTPVELPVSDGKSSIIFEDMYFNVKSVGKYVPDNRTRGFVKSEVFAEYIIVAGG